MHHARKLAILCPFRSAPTTASLVSTKWGLTFMGRAGRKRQTAIAREPNGRASRKPADEAKRREAKISDITHWDMMAVAVTARNRVHGVPLAVAKDQRAGSVVGRMVMAGVLTKAQGDASTRYAEDVAAYHQAISAPRQPGAVDLNAGHGQSVLEENVRAKLRAVRRYTGAREAVQGEADLRRGANLFAALDYFVLRDENHSHMLPWLRLALDALAVFYGMETERAA